MIGAVKTNIGHGEAASGLSALIKAILIVERGVIPPTVGIKKLSSKMKWDEWQVQVPVQPTPFPSHLPIRRVSVNTCGYGGTSTFLFSLNKSLYFVSLLLQAHLAGFVEPT